MFLLFFVVFFNFGLCAHQDTDLGYSLNIGNAIDVFANYGDLSQVTQVISADYDDSSEVIEPFHEKNIRVFERLQYKVQNGNTMGDMNIQLCETFDDLLSTYFQKFSIEGTDKPWKAFLGDWVLDEIMRTFGIEYDDSPDNCCYVLVRLTKIYKSVQVDAIESADVKYYVQRAIDRLNVTDPTSIRRFMKSYGTHYIDSFITGNFIYQVFKFKRTGFNELKKYVRTRNRPQHNSRNLRFHFSSLFLKQVGDIKIASGNKRIESWARSNLRDPQYLYSRPSLFRLHFNRNLAVKINDLLDDEALLGLGLKTLKPLFKNRPKGQTFAEIIENDLKLWEINA